MTPRIRGIPARWRRGASALEFALAAPIVTFITFAVLDYGNALQQIIRLEAAARAGAAVAFASPSNTAEIRTAVRTSLQYWPLATDNPAGNVSVAVDNTCRCPLPSTTTFNCTTGDPQNACGGTGDFRQYVSVSVTRPFSAVFIVPQTTVRGNVELRLR
jgi:Flp pilus assembly protein TadG